jgi:hypothetical protein
MEGGSWNIETFASVSPPLHQPDALVKVWPPPAGRRSASVSPPLHQPDALVKVWPPPDALLKVWPPPEGLAAA